MEGGCKDFATKKIETLWWEHLEGFTVRRRQISENLKAAQERVPLDEQAIIDVTKNLAQLRDELRTFYSRYDQWMVFRKAIEEDPVLEKEWDKFCMMMRLRDTTGFQDKEQDGG